MRGTCRSTCTNTWHVRHVCCHMHRFGKRWNAFFCLKIQYYRRNFNSHALNKTLLGVTKIGAVGNSRNCYWNSEMDTSETPKWDEMKRENSALAELRTCNCEKNWGNAAMCRGLDHTIPCLLANMCTWFIVEKVANNVNGIAWGCTLFVVEKSRKECQRDCKW